MLQLSLASRLFALSSVLLLAGCGASLPHSSITSTPAVTYSGRVHGGQQPVSGALVQLYTVGTTADGSAATPLLSSPVTSDANGNFNITGLYSCTAASEVYLLATGGNPGLSAPNPNLALMTALGPCSSLTPQTFISVNELTTVAAIYALSPFMTDAAHIGSSAADAAALSQAFSLAAQLVNSSTGAIQTPSLTAQLNTLADMAASCINSTGGSANDGTVCGKLFGLTSASGTTPADTVTALLNIAQNPTSNVQQLYQLIPASAPFQPTPSVTPPDLALQQTPSANAGSSLKIGPPTITFPGTVLSATAPAQTIVISNPTSAPITLNAIALNGLNQSDFNETSTCTDTLAPATNCTASITFTPHAAAARAATLSLTSNTPDSPQVISLAGTGASAIAEGPHAVVSNVIATPYPGASFDVDLSNSGNAPLTISSISLANTPFNTQTNNCPTSLPGSSSCTISLHSISAGADQLTINTDDPAFAPNILVSQMSAPSSNSGIHVVSPSDLFYPDTLVGAEQSLTFTYGPYGTGPAAIAGPQAADFAVSAPVCGPMYPNGPATCTLTVRFTPSAAGLRSARLNLDSSPNYIPLAGTGITAAPSSGLTLSASALVFDSNPAPQTLTLSNYGNSAIGLNSIALQSLLGPSEYTEVNNCGTSLAAQSICTVTVASSRRLEGGTQGMLSIETGAGTYHVPLTDSMFQVIDFGLIPLGLPRYQSAQYPVMEAFGRDTSYIRGVISGANSGDFQFNGCVSEVATRPCAGELSFVPTQMGVRGATLITTDTFSGYATEANQYTALGTGTATPAGGNVLFAQTGNSQVVGSTNTSKLVLTNLAPSAITTFGVTLSGAAPQNFSVGAGDCTPSPLSGGYASTSRMDIGIQCTYPVTLKATQTGFSTAIATVEDTTSGLSFSAPLYLAAFFGPGVSPAYMNIPPTYVNTVSSPVSVTVTRPSADPIVASGYGGVQPVKDTCAPGEVPCILTFVFAPTSVSIYFGAFVKDMATGLGTDLGVSSSIYTPVPPASASISPGAIIFPARAAATVSIPQTLTLSNGGPGSLTASYIGLSGPNAGEFRETTNCPFTLAVAATCTVSISFSPTTSGDKSAFLVVTGPANSGLPLSVPLVGTAQ